MSSMYYLLLKAKILYICKEKCAFSIINQFYLLNSSTEVVLLELLVYYSGAV